MKKVTLALIGAGERGSDSYAPYALSHPQEAQCVAVAEPNSARREKFRKMHNISEDMCFNTWEEMLEKPKLADAVLICVQDGLHLPVTIKALEKDYHVLLEKPMSNKPEDCVLMGEYAKRYKKVFSICHVLRYTNFFSALKKYIDDGRIGDLVSIQLNENVAYWHQAHSFVRGNWRNSNETSPMILAKSCHDMDILLWLAGADCVSLSSFGSLMHFKKENAPEGAPLRCLDGCPVENECPYYAPNQYLTSNIYWPTSVISDDMSIESRTKALKEGPYGRCVYQCDNNVVDHQVVCAEFANGVTAAFTMCAFTQDGNRTLKLMGTKAEIRAVLEKNEIEILDFAIGSREVIHLATGGSSHSGGDYMLIRDFIKLVRDNAAGEGRTSASISVQSHLMAFAAEKSRLEKKAINMKEYAEGFKK